METAEMQIILGGKPYKFTAPLMFKQLKFVQPALEKLRGEIKKGNAISEEAYELIAQVVVLTLREDNPSFARITFDAIRLLPNELNNAVTIIVKATSMYVEEAKGESGEVTGEASQSIGDSSTAS